MKVNTSAELSARRTAAAAVLADFRRETDAYLDDDTLQTPRPDYSKWAFLLCGELSALLHQLDAGDRAAGQFPDAAAQIAEIRRIFAGFDWEFHDRQLALEAIDDIVNRGQA